jgi:hypothetical protein
MSISVRHGVEYAALKWACSINMDIQYGHGYAAWTWNAAQTWACSMKMDTQHVMGPGTWT